MKNEQTEENEVTILYENEGSALHKVPVSLIVVNPIKLRAVDLESASFAERVEDIRNRGIVHPPTARVIDDAGVTKYQLEDGLHRFTAAKVVGHTHIILSIKNHTDLEVCYHQIAMNSQHTETKPMEFTKMLQHILSIDGTATIADLSTQTGKSVAWIKERLNLLSKITNSVIHDLIDDKKITANNAGLLAKLPPEEQLNYLTDAQILSLADFQGKINARVKELSDSRRQAQATKPPGFVAVPLLRKFNELKEAAQDEQVVAKLASQATTVEEAIRVALLYVVQMDALSIAERKQRDDEKKAADSKAKEDAKKKHQDAAAAKTAEAASRAESLL